LPEGGDEPGSDREDMPLILTPQPKHDHSRTVRGRICPDVREAAVEGDENAFLGRADLRNARIDLAAESLFFRSSASPTPNLAGAGSVPPAGFHRP
jgi:hypothetical protein